MRIVIVTPAKPGTRLGNRHTALRWARILRDAGARVDIVNEWHAGRQDAMIALHARKSRAAMLEFRNQRPERPIVLALTGTDLYRDIRTDAGAAASLEIADRLVVLQAEALNELSAGLRIKARVIHQAEVARRPWLPVQHQIRFCQLGHLRAEKDPFRAALALTQIPDMPVLRVVQAGAALDPGTAAEAGRHIRRDPRYSWLGDLPHHRAMRLLCSSHALIISSILEGGAHVVSEAIVHGVPVLASDIPGNRGLLGQDYPGFFRVGDTHGLADLMRRLATDVGYVAMLHQAVLARQPLFEPERETAAWRSLLAELHFTPD